MRKRLRAWAIEWGDVLFAAYRWYRRKRGGHWEQWYFDVVHSTCWIPVPSCYHQAETADAQAALRPPLGRSNPICEHYA